MRLLVCLLLVTCACATEDESRAKKQPFVVDAVGNTLPPPSNVPATVGSPVNLLTPDRYEFYTFDESGELVKRLMTLEEIQAIVAAGEEAEGLVTFANDNQPTMAFNFSQPPYNKVHSVVTNVQNVLKAQMEAHKNNPVAQPTLDTPDVSDSWSLILPSIFGNTGLDIVPDKIPNGVTPPETDTLDFHDTNLEISDDFTSKEGNGDVLSSSTTIKTDDNLKPISTTTTTFVEEVKITPKTTTKAIPTTTTMTPTTTTTTTSTTTTNRPTTTTTNRPTSTIKPSTTIKSTTTAKIATTTLKPIKRTTTTTTTTTTVKSSTIKPTTARKPETKLTTVTTKKTTKPYPTTESPVKTKITQATSSTTKLPLVSTTPTSNIKIRTTTSQSKITNGTNLHATSTTPKSTTVTSTKIAEKLTSKITTTRKPLTTKKQPVVYATTPKTPESSISKIEISNSITATDKNEVQYEKIDTFVPISTATYISERTTPNTQESKETENTSTTKTMNFITTTEKMSTEPQTIITTYKPTTAESNTMTSIPHNQDTNKLNVTTITTQSVSPSTTVSSTEFIKLENSQNTAFTGTNPIDESHTTENMEADVPLFDVAQSISQIASDLGGNYMPVPTVSNIMDTTKLTQMNLESKENFELEILTDNDSKNSNISEREKENFIKISTLEPHAKNNMTDREETSGKESSNKINNATQSISTEKNTAAAIESTTIDRILSESMGDLLFQVVNPAPHVESENKVITTEKNIDSTTTEFFADVITTTFGTSQTNTEREKFDNDIPSLENKDESLKPSVVTSTEVPVVINNRIASSENIGNEKGNPTFVKAPEVVVAQNNSDLDIKTEKSEIKDKNLIESSVKKDSKTTTEITPQKSESSTVTPISSETTPTLQEVILEDKKDNIKTYSTTTDVTKNIQDSKVSDNVPKIDDFKKKIQKVNIDDKELANERNNSWKLISTVTPPKSNEIAKDKVKNNSKIPTNNNSNKDIVLDFSKENQGLEVTTKDLEEDIAKFTELCNELAFRYWNTITENIDKRRSFVLSPYSITSMLAMMFMGARGATSGEMNDILKLDDMVTFNPHFTLKNISDSIETTPESGVIVSAFIRELYSDRNKGKILTFYKERAQQFYNGHVEEVNFKLISDIIRRRTNMLVKRYTWGRVSEYMKANTITMQPPLAAFATNIFQTDCSGSSVEGRDGEMYFVVSPTVRQRRLVPVPAVVYRSGFLAGYDPVLDATAAALGNTNSIISTLFVMPGQQGNVVHGEDLEALEQRLLDTNPTTPAWNRLLRTLLPRIGLELQIPRFSHKSIFNVSSTLRNMGLKDLFDAEHADLGGLNGPSKDLYLSDMIQSTSFVTCGEGVIGEQHHIEEYPESLNSLARRRSSRWTSDWDEPRDYQRAFHDPHDVGEAMHLPLHLRPRQARLPSRNAQPARLKFDRPFLYFVRHNPSGMILYVGRYNPRLLP